MFTKLHDLFKQLTDADSSMHAVDQNTLESSMASLLCEVASADNESDEREESAKCHQLVLLLNIDEAQAKSLLIDAHSQSKQAVSIYEFTSKLRNADYQIRHLLIEAMWAVAFADGIIDPYEEALIRQVSDLIYVTHSDFIRAKLSVQN